MSRGEPANTISSRFGGLAKEPGTRAMDERHLALALYVDEARQSGLGWKELHRRWNEVHPKWRYETANDPHVRRFALEARRKWSRLTGEQWRDLRDERLVRRPASD
jgi:hypothetical protein